MTGPGPGSGKLATCLSQLYHEYRRGIHAGYAKFETFPIWNLPLKHPVNVAYEAATADIRDFNLIDPFHLEAYGKTAVNYNRDVEAFPLVRRILERITGGESFYKSPTDMGVNRAGFAIVDDEVTREAAKQEVIRRYFRYRCEYAMGFADHETVQRVELLMKDFRPRARGPQGRRAGPPGGPRGAGAGQGQRGHLLRRGDRAEGRHHRHGEQLAADARRVERRPQRHQAPGRNPGHDQAASRVHHRIRRTTSKRTSSTRRA